MRPGNAERIEDVDRVVGLPEVAVALQTAGSRARRR
jgi:hypothetical protein